MDLGGEPERDESGLPPLDMEIPDDARELVRDVHAYYRELRAQRRRRRIQRIIAPFTKHGIVIPLIAATLAVTLFAGTMLTVITSVPEPVTPMPQPRRHSASPSIPPPGQLGGLLPSAVVWVGGRATPLRDVRPAVFAIILPGCDCLTALRQLTGQAVAARVKVYVTGTGGALRQAAALAARITRITRITQPTVQVVDDAQNILGGFFHPLGLTAILVRGDGVVTSVVTRLRPGFDLGAKLRLLAAPGRGSPASDGPRPS